MTEKLLTRTNFTLLTSPSAMIYVPSLCSHVSVASSCPPASSTPKRPHYHWNIDFVSRIWKASLDSGHRNKTLNLDSLSLVHNDFSFLPSRSLLLHTRVPLTAFLFWLGVIEMSFTEKKNFQSRWCHLSGWWIIYSNRLSRQRNDIHQAAWRGKTSGLPLPFLFTQIHSEYFQFPSISW